VALTFDENAEHPEDSLQVLIVDRWTHPFKDRVSLPGTFLHADDENALKAIERMLVERFGITTKAGVVQQLQTFTGRDRDPRGQIVSIAHILYIRDGLRLIHGIDGVHWVPLRSVRNMDFAFDHNVILNTAVNRLRDQFGWIPNVFYTLPDPFTLTDAIRLRSSLFDEDYHDINRANFKKKYQPMWSECGIVDPADPRSPKLFSWRLS
jgi:ADP-ribose pyrophosphatase YjhB (NUDIX family)